MLQAATHLFTEYGFEKTSMQKIADEAGVGVATLFRYFPRKELLIIDVVKAVIEGMVPHFEAITQSKQSGYHKMEAILDAYIQYLFSANKESVTLLENFEYYVAYNPVEEPLLLEIREAYTKIGRVISEALNEGMRDGSISLQETENITVHTILNLFGTAIKKHAFTSLLPSVIVPVPTGQELHEVKALILRYLKKS